MEICCLVFGNLEIYQAFHLRRVSKRWHSTLSAPVLVESMLRPWFLMGDVELRIPPDSDTDDVLAIKAEHVDAFRNGNPFSMMEGTWHAKPAEPHQIFPPLLVSYCFPRLAWIDRSQRKVHMRHLEYGPETSFEAKNRERLIEVSVSKDMLATATDSGWCHVWECATGAPHSIRTPSAFNVFFATCGSSLATLTCDVSGKSLSATTWRLNNRKTHSFDVKRKGNANIRHGNIPWETCMTEESILFFEREPGPPDRFYFTRYSLYGEIIAEGSSGLIDRTFHAGYCEIHISPDTDGVNTIPLEELDRRLMDDQQEPRAHRLRKDIIQRTRGIICPVYDLRKNQLTFKDYSVMSCKHFEGGDKSRNHWWFWKDIAYCSSTTRQRDIMISVVDLAKGTVKDTNMLKKYLDSLGPEDESFQGWTPDRSRDQHLYRHPARFSSTEPCWFIGDEIFMIRIFPDGYEVFCFDKHITLPKPSEMWQFIRSEMAEGIWQQPQVVEEAEDEVMDDMRAELANFENAQREQEEAEWAHQEQGQVE